MRNIEFSDVEITGGYWKARQEINSSVTLMSVYERFKETHRFDALQCLWKDGNPNMPHIFWDSDVAKWIEGAAYILNSKEDAAVSEIIDSAVECIIKNSDENGYFNSHFLVTEQQNRFCNRNCHELYCAGHLMEAAVAYYEITGKASFLKAMCKFADYIEKVFKNEKSAAFTTPGHPELELALMRLYKATGEKRYADLAKYFIDEHGKRPEKEGYYIKGFNEAYNQDEMPIKNRSTAEGHCVRSMYLMCGAADVAAEYGDADLKEACERVFDNVVYKRMYITGGIGPTYIGEAFTIDYDLPNRTAYAETCAAISLSMFANRMLQFGADAKYADIVEKTMYNGVMSGVSMDGKSFFYENPLEIDPDFNNVNTSAKDKQRFPITQRLEVFDCSCCPPNILRYVASVAGFLYSFDDNTIYVHQYMDSKTETDSIRITQKTEYPKNGKVLIQCNTDKKMIALRIPGWCKSFTINQSYVIKRGYAYITLNGNDEIEVAFDMPVRLIAANRRVHSDAGRVAVMRGPVVYCAEEIDNGPDLKSVLLDIHSNFELQDSPFLLPLLKTKAYRPKETERLYYEAGDDYEEIPLSLIPYYAFANRGETEMQVWLLGRR